MDRFRRWTHSSVAVLGDGFAFNYGFLLKLYLGGTFNPPHIGHMRMALECHLATGADVVFVPCADPPHKPIPDVSVEHRLQMIQLAASELSDIVQKRSAFSVDDCEIRLQGPSYTVRTLEYLRERNTDVVLAWLIGMDSFVNLHTWHRWQDLTDKANLLVVNRPGWELPKAGPVSDWLVSRKQDWQTLASSGGVAFLETTPVDISSTQLRTQLAQGIPGNYLVPDAVWQYILSHRLYQGGNSFSI